VQKYGGDSILLYYWWTKKQLGVCIQVYSKLRSHKIEYFKKSDFKSQEKDNFK